LFGKIVGMTDALTPRTSRLIALAKDVSRRCWIPGCDRSDLALLIAIVEDDGGVAATILRPLGLSLQELYKDLPWRAEPAPPSNAIGDAGSDAIERLLRDAVLVKGKLRGHEIGTEHLLIAMVRSPNSAAGKALAKAGITEAVLQERANWLP
jgi:ATP-dependent Clp protease ATP-binding subunit ClpA